MTQHEQPGDGSNAVSRDSRPAGSGEAGPSDVDQIFREQALEQYRRGVSGPGEVLRIAPSWTRWFFWLLVSVFVFAAAYLTFGRISEYAEGPAVVTVEGKLELTARAAGTVRSVEVRPQTHVEAGQLLVRFYDAYEAAELEQARQAFELQLINLLKNPADATAREELTALRARVDFAERRLLESSLRAPVAGVVRDVRIRPGQQVLPGDVVLSIVDETAPVSIVAMLPGQFRPLLRPGLGLRLEVSGYEYAYQELAIESVGAEVIGPAEARRFLGAQISDSVMLPGPVVLVHARLPERTFRAAGQTHTLHDGMHGRAQARVREERLLFTLVPGLKTVFEDGH